MNPIKKSVAFKFDVYNLRTKRKQWGVRQRKSESLG